MSLARLLPQLANLQTYNFEINFDVSIIIIIKSCNHVLSGMYQKLTIFETPRIFYPFLKKIDKKKKNDHWHCCCVIPGVGHSITAWSLVTGCRLSRLISTKYLCISTRTLSSSPISHDTPQPGTKLWLNYPLRDSIISRVYQYSVFLSGLAAHH